MSKELFCPDGQVCGKSCPNHDACQEKHSKEMQDIFFEIMAEADAKHPDIEVWDHCPCDTCIYADKEVCEMENEEPFKSKKFEGCADWDEGEIESDY